MRLLLYSSILILAAGCSKKISGVASSFKEPCIQQAKPSFHTVLYKTSVDVTSHHLSGLLLMKNTGDTTRIVFTSEMGLTYFDFSYIGNNFKVNYCIRKLNRKIVTNQL